jgi:hypothetical protein
VTGLVSYWLVSSCFLAIRFAYKALRERYAVA